MEILATNLAKRIFFVCVALLFSLNVWGKGPVPPSVIAVRDLPIEAQETLTLIKRGGPFPFLRDGVVFKNYEGVLPRRKRGYYHEYTVKTPGTHNRGARRIISGGTPQQQQEYFYTDDHYVSFKRIRE